MKKSKQAILNELVKELQKNRNIKSIMQVGSSLWDPKSKDIDLILITKGSMPAYDDLKFLSTIKNKFIKKYGILFGKGGILEEIKTFNVDLIIIPEKYQIFYSFNPLLVYGMSLNPRKVLYGYDFFQKIKKRLRANNEMLFKFGGSLANFYFSFILNFDSLTPKNSKIILSFLKIILYPLVFMKNKHVTKKEMIPFLKAKYAFFNKLCKKYKIKNDIFYKAKLSDKEIKKIYGFTSELVEKIYCKFTIS